MHHTDLMFQSFFGRIDFDRSAARGQMAVRKLIIFKHDSEFGNAPAHKLFDLVSAVRKEGVLAARAFSDYDVTVNTDAIPSGVTCEIRD